MLVVIAGIAICLQVLRWHAGAQRPREPVDIHLRGIDKAELLATYRERDPRQFETKGELWRSLDWSDIHLRIRFDPVTGSEFFLLRCRIPPAQAPRLYRTREDSPLALRNLRRPLEPGLPADWPAPPADPDDPYPPAWFGPRGVQALRADLVIQGRRLVKLIDYDPAERHLHVCFADVQAGEAETDPARTSYTDDLAMAISRRLVAARHPVVADGWLHAPRVDARDDVVLPPGVDRVAALFLPRREGHRYLLAVHGPDAAAARHLLRDTPLHPLPDDAPPPLERWSFALPAPAELAPPPWFAPGPGPRWQHCLVLPGPGTVLAGRWAAHDAAERTLYVWDWTTAEPRDPAVDLAEKPPRSTTEPGADR